LDGHENLDDLCRSHLVSIVNCSVDYTSMPLNLFQIGLVHGTHYFWMCLDFRSSALF
jgi:hypothetical protein